MSPLRNPWTNVYGVARSLLALCTLVALLADGTDLLFRPLGVEVGEATFHMSLVKLSLFSLLSGSWLPLAKAIAAGLLLLVIAGWRPRWTAIPHWWVTASFASSSLVVEGGDQVAAILALFLIPVALTDSRRWHWEAPPALAGTARQAASVVAGSCLSAIRLQVAVIYFFACTAKLGVTEWANGTALYYWLIHPTFGLSETLRPVFLPILASPWGVTLLTWGVLLLEALLFMGLLMEPRHRPLLLKAGLVFHLGIVVFHGLFTFFLAMAGALILYLRPIDQPFRLALPWPRRVARGEPASCAPAISVPGAEVS